MNISLLFGMLLSAALSVCVSCAPAEAGGKPHHHAEAPFTTGMHESMRTMMKDMDAAPMTGNPDRDFLAMMIPHHEGAVEMARLLLIHGRDPLTRRLAEEIIASQTVEIDAMKKRLRILTAGSEQDRNTFPDLGGTRGTKENVPQGSP